MSTRKKHLTRFSDTNVKASFYCVYCQKEHQIAQFKKGNIAAAWDVIRLLKWQKGVCPICRKPICLLQGQTWAKDHDHKCCPSGKSCAKYTRGILCGKCNRMLGLANDNTTVLRHGANYLATWRKRKTATRIPLKPIYHVLDEELIELIQKGWRLEDIASKFSCSIMTAHRRIKTSGILLPRPGPRKS